MSTIPTTDPVVGAYLASVRAALADLEPDERDALCEDLEQHLTEVAAEFEEPLTARLGPPEAYAAELRATAGLARGPAPSAGGLLRRARLLDARALTAVRSLSGALSGDGWLPEALRDLRPAWWAARGYLGVLGLALLLSTTATMMSFPIPHVGGEVLGLALGLAAAAGSLELGRRSRTSEPHRRAGAAVSVVVLLLVLLGIGALRGATHELAGWRSGAFEAMEQAVTRTGQGGLVASDGRLITNIHPYGPDGQPLEGLLLYDQDGVPIEIELEHSPDGYPVVTSFPVSADGRPLLHVFPQRQAERLGEGGDPGMRPFGVPPRVVLPPLERSTEEPGEPARTEASEAAEDVAPEAEMDGERTSDEPAPEAAPDGEPAGEAGG